MTNNVPSTKFMVGLLLFIATPGMMTFAPAIDAVTATTLESGAGSADPILWLLPVLWRLFALVPWALGILALFRVRAN